MRGTPTEGKNGVPLRFPRPVMATAAIGLAVAWAALGSVPALADQVRNQEWWLAKLNVTQAWHTARGSGVTVALLDTGVYPAQPDLSGSVLPGPAEAPAWQAPRYVRKTLSNGINHWVVPWRTLPRRAPRATSVSRMVATSSA